MEHSKYYYDLERNMDISIKKNDIPIYYESKGIEARKVIEAFQPDNFNIGTAISYLLRAGKKIYVNGSPTDSMREDISKAIAHLKFELERK
tara:strand:+ start:63 stop:335 length:273 start_codon:yes stop_codon:yes gene_type:complete